MGKVYRYLGLSVGLVHGLNSAEEGRIRRGHHLRYQQRIRVRLSADNMVIYKEDKVQRPTITQSWTKWTPS